MSRLSFLCCLLFFGFIHCIILGERTFAKGGDSSYFSLMPSDIRRLEFDYLDLAEESSLIRVSHEWDNLFFQKLNSKPDVVWLDLFAVAAEERNNTLARRILENAKVNRPQIIPELITQTIQDAHSVGGVGNVALPAFAVYHRNFHLLELLAKYGLDLKERYLIMDRRASLFELAVERDDLKSAQFLIAQGAAAGDPLTLLYTAAINGSVGAVEVLHVLFKKDKTLGFKKPLFYKVLSELIVVSNLTSSDELTQKRIDAVKWLYHQEESPERAAQSLTKNNRALRLVAKACTVGHPEVLSFLFEVVGDEDLKQQMKRKAWKTVKRLFKSNSQDGLFNKKLIESVGFLQALGSPEDLSEIQKDILAAQISVASDVQEVETPINKAIFDRNIPLLKALIRRGENVDRPGVSSKTPLDIAFETGSFSAVKVLLEAGATTADLQYKNQPLLLGLIERAKFASSTHRLNNLIRIIRYIFWNRDRIRAFGSDTVPLAVVAEVGNLDLLKALITMGMSPHVVGRTGLTPLQNVQYWLLRCDEEANPQRPGVMSAWDRGSVFRPAGVVLGNREYKEKLEKVRDYLQALNP
jgi:ankyrin repeat protein